MPTIPIDDVKRQLAELRSQVRGLREQCEAGDDALRRAERKLQALKEENQSLLDIGIPCELYCPSCGLQHIDAPEPENGWTNPPHRTHKCHACGHLWKPYPVATYGVVTIPINGIWLSRREAALAFQAFDTFAPRTPGYLDLHAKLRAAAASRSTEGVA